MLKVEFDPTRRHTRQAGSACAKRDGVVVKLRIPDWIPSFDRHTPVEISVGGAARKTVLRDPASGQWYIAKLGGRNSDLEVATEYAIYLVGKNLGVQVAEGGLAIYQGKLRFTSRYFLNVGALEQLVHGVELFRELYDAGKVQQVVGNRLREQEFFTVQAVRDVLGAHYLDQQHRLFTDFIKILAHDAIIGVQDRHHENWGIVRHREIDSAPPRIAPIYDSARGLFCTFLDDDLKARYIAPSGVAALRKYNHQSGPLFGWHGWRARPNQRKFINHFELIARTYWAYPETRIEIEGLLKRYDWRRLQVDMAQQLSGLFSPMRQQLVLNCLRRRIKGIRRAIDDLSNSGDHPRNGAQYGLV